MMICKRTRLQEMRSVLFAFYSWCAACRNRNRDSRKRQNIVVDSYLVSCLFTILILLLVASICVSSFEQERRTTVHKAFCRRLVAHNPWKWKPERSSTKTVPRQAVAVRCLVRCCLPRKRPRRFLWDIYCILLSTLMLIGDYVRLKPSEQRGRKGRTSIEGPAMAVAQQIQSRSALYRINLDLIDTLLNIASYLESLSLSSLHNFFTLSLAQDFLTILLNSCFHSSFIRWQRLSI